MRLYDKVFDKLFPSVAHGFDTSLAAKALYTGDETEAEQNRLWLRALCADVLLIRATSYRQPEDLFTRPRFWSDLLEFLALNEGATMARSKVQRSQADRAEWKGFLDRRLSDEELEELDNWKPKPIEVFAIVDEMMAADFRMTLSYSKRTGLASCTVIDDDPKRKTAGYALSTADENCAAALKAAVFKHAIVLKSDWSVLVEQPPKARRG